jgi:L-threonylcarbamoyladenylate synthase
MVLPRAASIPDAVTAGLNSVAVRMPRHPLALELLRRCDLPLAAPSANKSGEVSPTRPEHVLQSLGEVVPVLDGGTCEVGIESTVIDLRSEIPVLLRPGIISKSELEGVLGKIASPSTSPESEARPSPGMLDRHYAPKARVHIFPTLTDAHFHAVLLGSGKKLGVIAFRATKLNAEEVLLPTTPEGYAQRIYGALRQLDNAGCELILIEDLPRTPQWDALRDRLSRAAKPL